MGNIVVEWSKTRMSLSLIGDWATFVVPAKDKIKTLKFRWEAFQKVWYRDFSTSEELDEAKAFLLNMFPLVLRPELFENCILPIKNYLPTPIQTEEVNIKVNTVESVSVINLPEKLKSVLKDHQKKAIERTNTNAKTQLLAIDMGGGKTLTSISTAMSYNKKMFIVTPKSLQERWVEEFVKFDLIHPSKIVILEGNKAQILSKFEKPYEVYIISYEKLRFISKLDQAKPEEKAIYNEIKKLNPNDFVLIFEEMYKVKNYKSQLYKAFKKFRWENNWYSVIGLTGTPLEKDLFDYYNIINILQKDVVPYKDMFNIYSYSDKWGKVTFRNHKQFNEAVKNLVYRVKKEEIMQDLPPLTQEFRFVDHSVHGHKIKASILDKADSIFNAYTMLRVVDSYVKDGVENSFKDVLEVCEHNGKFEEVVNILDDLADKQIFIYTAFERTALWLREKLIKEGYKTIAVTGSDKEPQKMVNSFLSGEYQVLIGTSVLARGYDMPHIDYVLLWDTPVSASVYAQVIGRIHRINSTRGKTAITLVSDIIERDIYNILEKKFKQIELFVEGVEDENIYEALAKNWGMKKTSKQKTIIQDIVGNMNE